MPALMGVVNVTPDSFSDGGRFLAPEAAIEHGLELAREGADVLDVGGESTRPGATPVGAEEEIERVAPVVAGLAERQESASISVDTSKLAVAEAALDAGATIVNDVTALRADPEIAGLCADRGAGLILMHMLETPQTMQDDPRYEDVVEEVRAFLSERAQAAIAAAVDEERIWLDPGIGFGKTRQHNLELLAHLDRIAELGFPVAIGTSRKAFLGTADGAPATDRLGGTISSNLIAWQRGASILRVHEIAPLRQALMVAAAIHAA